MRDLHFYSHEWKKTTRAYETALLACPVKRTRNAQIVFLFKRTVAGFITMKVNAEIKLN